MSIGGDDDEVEVGGNGEGGEDASGQNVEQDVGEEADDATEQPDAAEDDGEQEVDAEPPRSRGQNRFQTLANERKAEKDRADRLERELHEARRERQQSNQHLSQREEAERLALMTPEERVHYSQDKFQREMRGQLQQTQLQMQLTADQTSYNARAAVDPLYKKYQGRVESQFQDLLQQGKPTDRETILTFLLGKDARDRAANPKAKQAAQKRVDAQRVNGGSPRGDRASTRGKTGETAESRLKDQYI